MSALSTAHLEALADLERLTAIASIDLLNPDLVERLDEISRRTMTRLGHQAAYVSIVLDTAQLILSSAGMSGWICQAGGTPIEWAFCGHTVALARPYTVEDASQHPAHQASPLVTDEGTRAYAGVPLVSATGQVLGAHCVIDSEPHQFTPDEIAELQAAAAEIVQVLTEHSIPAQTSSANA